MSCSVTLADGQQGWEVERLLWLAVYKGDAEDSWQYNKVAKVMSCAGEKEKLDVSRHRQQKRACYMNLLQPSMVRRIMKHLMLLGGPERTGHVGM